MSAAAPAIAFDDKLEGYKATTVYPVCNENIFIWRDVIERAVGEVDNAAAICSGGEVSFFGILPYVKKSAELIDHCYTSMYYAIGKYHVINKFDVQEAWDKLMTKNTRFGAPYLEVYSDGYYDRQGRWTFGKPPTTKPEKGSLAELFAEANNGVPTADHSGRSNRFSLTEMQHAWRGLTTEDLQAFKDSMGKVRFVHDDINGLRERGPFDLVYLSNALQYGSKGGRCTDVKSMVKPGGYVLLAYGGYGRIYVPEQVKEFEHVECKTITDYNDHPERHKKFIDGGSWSYNVFKAPPKGKAKAS